MFRNDDPNFTINTVHNTFLRLNIANLIASLPIKVQQVGA